MHLPLKLDPKTRRCVIQDRTSKQEYLLELPLKSPFIYMYTVLRELSAHNDEGAFYRALLSLNLFGLETDAATISLDQGSKNILLHLSFPIEFLTPQLLVNLLTNFITTGRIIRAKIENLEVATNQELRRRKTHYSIAEAMDEKNPKQAMRVIKI